MFFKKRKNTFTPEQPQETERAVAGALRPEEWKRSMERILSLADSECERVQSENWDDVYAFLIDMLGRELAGHYGYRGYDNRYGIDLRQLVCIPSCFEKQLEKEVRVVKAAGMNMVCFPRNLARLPTTLRNVKENGYLNGIDSVCIGTYYPELNLCVVDNRHHHAAAAGFYGVGGDVDVEVTIRSIKPLFDLLTVDCDFHWASGTIPSVTGEPVDPRFAAMYELARRRERFLDGRKTIE